MDGWINGWMGGWTDKMGRRPQIKDVPQVFRRTQSKSLRNTNPRAMLSYVRVHVQIIAHVLCTGMCLVLSGTCTTTRAHLEETVCLPHLLSSLPDEEKREDAHVHCMEH